MPRHLIAVVALLTAVAAFGQQPAFKLAPAVCVEAEDFTVESGWNVIRNGDGNYMVDIIGFNHVSGERLLGIDATNSTASAFADVELPEDGDYRLWVRYEYPPFAEARFRVVVMQGGATAADAMMGASTDPRYSFGEVKARPQYDPPWGPEGLVDQVVTVPALKKGKARIYLKGVEQPQVPGRTANRNIDFVYLTRDTKDEWLTHYQKQNNLYPILDAFRDSRGPRWEVRFTNHGEKPAGLQVNHHYNRHPWGIDEGVVIKDVKPGEASPWLGLRKQDTTHYGLIQFSSTTKEPFDLDIRPAGGGEVVRKAGSASEYAFYFPHYPGWKEPIISQLEAIENARTYLAERKPIGRVPTRPLCYGGWIDVGRDDSVGRAYAKLYAELGMRSMPAASGPAVLRNLESAGLKRIRSESVMTYRNPPTTENIAAAKKQYAGDNLQFLQWYDYGDEIGFGEWIDMMLQDQLKQPSSGRKPTAESLLAAAWKQWLTQNRSAVKKEEYWLPKWGAFDETKLKPDSSAEAAKVNPRLYVDSVIFYEDTAMRFAAEGMKGAKQQLGPDVWCGANYSGHPFYCPTTTMYVKWFRRQCADMGRHSEYFWQVGQAGPMINGYFAEHFRAGFRNNPRAILRQYTMPHAPGNSDASFLRMAFSHLAHGAKMLDFFGIGMNDSWTENYVDFRYPQRYDSIRQVTHALGLVEDVILDSKVMPSPVALLVSESTERWDFAGIATDKAGHAHFGPEFRKTRLHHHVERFGIWQQLTFLGFSPDLVVEEDLTPDILRGYQVLIIVGDCLDPDRVKAIDGWVQNGGVLLATSMAGNYNPYRATLSPLFSLLGLEFRSSTEAETFVRVRQELPYLKPKTSADGDGWKMPVVVANERIKVSDAAVLARFRDDQSPALVSRNQGKGKVFYTATYPGISSLWTALQPPIVADRSPMSHLVPTNFDPGARALLELPLKTAGLESAIGMYLPLVDARLIDTGSGYLLPLANYNAKVGQPLTLRLRITGPFRRVSSAYLGDLPAREFNGRWVVTLKELGYGDILRFDR